MNKEDTPPPGYQLLDSGRGAKLEQVGPFLMVRPSPQAVWLPSLPDGRWQAADAVYIRSSSGGGRWKFNRPLPERWAIECNNYRFYIKATGFGHLGIFPEQQESWQWIRDRVKRGRKGMQVLNLFAYTGGSTLAAAAAGAEVCHVDASKGVVEWARENADLSGLGDRPVRWIVDDVKKFILKEIRRSRKYEGIILDPPTFGRGAKGEVWKIEEDLPKLLMQCRDLLTNAPSFILLSCHSPGFTPLVLQNLVAQVMGSGKGKVYGSEMSIPEGESGRLLPSGSYARWSST